MPARHLCLETSVGLLVLIDGDGSRRNFGRLRDEVLRGSSIGANGGVALDGLLEVAFFSILAVLKLVPRIRIEKFLLVGRIPLSQKHP